MAEFDADAFADSLPGWDPEARAAFLASLDDDDAPELPLLAESVDEMDPAMVEALRPVWKSKFYGAFRLIAEIAPDAVVNFHAD